MKKENRAEGKGAGIRLEVLAWGLREMWLDRWKGRGWDRST